MSKTVTITPASDPFALAASCSLGDTLRIANGCVLPAGVKTSGVFWVINDGATVTINAPIIDGTGISGGFGLLYVGAGVNNTKIIGGSIRKFAGAGIYGYPSQSVTVDGVTIDSTTDDGIHFAAASGNNTLVQNCVITNCRRIPIEAQLSGSNIQILSNYTSQIQPATGSWMGISAACGNATGVTVSGNTMVSDKLLGAALEAMGYNFVAQNNISYNFLNFLLNGAQGSQITCGSNKAYGAATYWQSDAVPWSIAKIVSPEPVLPLNAIPMPQPPGTGPTPPIPPQPPVTGASMFATATTNTITLNFSPSQSAGTCTATVAGNGQSIPSVTVPAGVQAITFSNLNPNWSYKGTLTQGIVSQNWTAQTLAKPGDLAAADGTPATPPLPIPPVPPVTQTHTISVFSDGSIKTQ